MVAPPQPATGRRERLWSDWDDRATGRVPPDPCSTAASATWAAGRSGLVSVRRPVRRRRPVQRPARYAPRPHRGIAVSMATENGRCCCPIVRISSATSEE